MNARQDLIERVRSGGSCKLVNIEGQVARDGRIYSSTPPAAGLKGHAYLTAVEVVDKQRFPYLWEEEDLDCVRVIVYEREPTPEELAEPCCIWF